MAKPADLPVWDSNQTNNSTADAGGYTYQDRMDDGWIEVSSGIFEKPPAEYFNYWMNLCYLWIAELDALTETPTTSQAGITEYATTGETQAMISDEVALTPSNLDDVRADNTETQTGVIDYKFVTPASLDAKSASAAEAKAMSSSSRLITPANLADLRGAWNTPTFTFESAYWSSYTSSGVPFQFRLLEGDRVLELIGRVRYNTTGSTKVGSWSGAVSSYIQTGGIIEFPVSNISEDLSYIGYISYDGSETSLTIRNPTVSDVIAFCIRISLDLNSYT